MEMPPVSSMNEKAKDKVEGYHIKILDDGSYLLCEEHTKYEKRVESSHESFESLMSALHKKMKHSHKKEKDYLTDK